MLKKLVIAVVLGGACVASIAASQVNTNPKQCQVTIGIDHQYSYNDNITFSTAGTDGRGSAGLGVYYAGHKTVVTGHHNCQPKNDQDYVVAYVTTNGAAEGRYISNDKWAMDQDIALSFPYAFRKVQ